MNRTFPYLQKDGQYFPIVKVQIKTPKRKLSVEALIDSGASFSVFRSEVADYLGIPLEKGKPVYLTGIGGRILGYLHRVSIEVGNKTFICKIIFSKEFMVSFNILGRDNFFEYFLITFNEKNKKLILN